jgi:hypothetical protein
MNILPVKVCINKRKAMNLIALWAQNNSMPKRRYIGNVWCALNYYNNLPEALIDKVSSCEKRIVKHRIFL